MSVKRKNRNQTTPTPPRPASAESGKSQSQIFTLFATLQKDLTPRPLYIRGSRYIE